MTNKKITPVLIGADLNCYNVARAFHEEYGVCSYAFGRYAIGATKYTKIVKFTTVPELDEPSVLCRVLEDFAAAHKGETLILLGCTDDYVSMIIQLKDRIPAEYVVPYIDRELMERLTLKASFYEYCEKFEIPYPKTVVCGSEGLPESLPFDYPIIIKPSSSILYWKYPFDGMKKVYRAKDRSEADAIVKEIYASGYPDKLIIQDTIPGNDSNMYVLTSYSDKNGKVRMMCLGHVLLEEHTPKGLGNHCAIVTEYMPELCERFKKLLEETGYVGFSNFDIKFDSRDGSMRAFEINIRQGRSNYYVTAAGQNIARLLVEDRVNNLEQSGCHIVDREAYWRYIPDDIVYKYISPELRAKIKELKKKKAAYSSLRYSHDLRMNPKRALYVAVYEHRHRAKFKKYLKV